MTRRRGVSRLEAGIGLLVIGVLFLTGLPLLGAVCQNVHQDEIPIVLQSTEAADVDMHR